MPCYRFTINGMPTFVCGKLGPRCRCGAPGSDALCDYPVGKGRTCDANMCSQCATEVAPDLHYCRPHYSMWTKYREEGGVQRELENVVPFRTEDRG